MAQECDFCGQNVHTPSLGDHHDKRFCYDCNTVTERNALIKISEVIGMPHHVVVEIEGLQAKAALVDPMLEALEKIKRETAGVNIGDQKIILSVTVGKVDDIARAAIAIAKKEG